MKRIRFLAAVLVCLLVFGLAGCGAGAKSQAGDMAAPAVGAEAGSANLSKPGSDSQMAMPAGQKLIRTVTIEAQTREMDGLLTKVEERIAELGGYVEGRDIYNGTTTQGETRHANLTIRIPADKLDQFVKRLDEASNIVSHQENTEDVTLTYVDTESRIKALETQEARLLELMEAAESLEDLLLLEKELTGIRSELEQLKSRLRTMDSLVNYSTVHLSVTEVKEYTEPEEEEPPRTVWQRMGDGFMATLRAVGNFFVGLAIVLVSALPVLVPVGVVVGLVLLSQRRKRQKAQEAKAALERWEAKLKAEQTKTEEKTE